MTDDSPARNQSAMLSSVDADYDAIHAAIVATERGRWFLEEYARRNRAADTGVVLAAIERIEQTIRGGPATDSALRLEPSDAAAFVEAIGKARSEAVGRQGDPAAVGDAALADFRNAVEQIQELVWGMHGRDAASEYGSQLSLQSNRLTSAGDRIERSLGGLRILLALIDDLEQRLCPLAGAPPTPSPVPETSSMEMPTVEPLPQIGELADGISGAKGAAPILTVATPEIKWSPAAHEEETLQAAVPQLEPISERAPPEGESSDSEQAVPAAQFEPLWQVPEAPAEPMADTAEDEDEARFTSEWACHTEEPAPITHVEASQPPLPDVTPEPQASLVEQQLGPVEPPLPSVESLAYGHWHEAATSAPPAEAEEDAPPAAEYPPPQPDLAHRDEAVADTERVQEEIAEIVTEEAAELSTTWPLETPGAASSAIEWFEVPAADAASLGSAFDAELFDSEDKLDTDVDSGGKSAIDALQAGESSADERQPAVEDVAAEDIEWLTTGNNTDAVSSPEEPADAPQPYDEPARRNLDDIPAELSSLHDSTSDGLPPSEPLPEGRPIQESEATAEQGETASSAYNWPSTFARETIEGAVADPSSAASRASAAYHALQSSSYHSAYTEPPAPATDAPEPEAGASEPFAEESPDVPSVIERLESVRSAIAALMDEVSEKGPRRTGTSRS